MSSSESCEGSWDPHSWAVCHFLVLLLGFLNFHLSVFCVLVNLMLVFSRFTFQIPLSVFGGENLGMGSLPTEKHYFFGWVRGVLFVPFLVKKCARVLCWYAPFVVNAGSGGWV